MHGKQNIEFRIEVYVECYRYKSLLVPLLLDDSIFVKHKYFPTRRVITDFQCSIFIELQHWQNFANALFNSLKEYIFNVKDFSYSWSVPSPEKCVRVIDFIIYRTEMNFRG